MTEMLGFMPRDCQNKIIYIYTLNLQLINYHTKF